MTKLEKILRGLVLYGTLIFVFFAAWYADKYPTYGDQALLAAIIVALIEVGVFALLSAKLQNRFPYLAISYLKNRLPRSYKYSMPKIAHDDIVANVISPSDISERSLIAAAYLRSYQRHMYSVSALQAFQLAYVRDLQERRRLPAEIRKWTLSEQSENAFTVEAGAFVIEHFHGHTNIKVNDPDRVTVQPSPQISTSDIRNFALAGLKFPVFN
jgi:hypothetical protein